MIKINNTIKDVLKITDLVLLDIKHINSQKCKQLTGFDNSLELEFANYLSDKNIPIWIRQVIIPGYTDNINDLKELKKFISNLKSIKKIELLPYHKKGIYKWENLNLKYELTSVREANDNDIKKVKKILGIS